MADSPEPNFANVFDGLFPEAACEDAEPVPLDPEQVFSGAADPVRTHLGNDTAQPRFDGDTSQLPHEVCWTLQELVAAPHVSEKARKHWAVVVEREDVLRSRLSELGLLLEVNHEHRYAFTRQAEDPSPHSRAILRTKTLSLAASTLALHLYHQYLLSPDNPVVETADMIDHMMAYKPATDTDDAAYQKKIRTAIRTLDDAAVIKPIKGTDRYIIYGVITSILTADQVDVLSQRYKEIASGETARSSDSDSDSDSGENDD